MRLTKLTSDAIRILVLCQTTDGALQKVAALSATIGVTKPLGLKLVNQLARLGYVDTVRGPNGGIRLAAGVADRPMGQLVRELEAFELHRATTSATGEGGDRATAHQLENMVDDAFDAFLAVLDQQTIADLAQRELKSRARTKKTQTPEPTAATDSGRRPPRRSPSRRAGT
ncbi:MAG: Rrf2 family transcriptional regulator [Pseudomonadota bacterium]